MLQIKVNPTRAVFKGFVVMSKITFHKTSLKLLKAQK